MKLNLMKLRELALAATSGPWHRVDPPWGESDWVVATSTPIGDPHGGTPVCDCDMMTDRGEEVDRSHENAAFIAAANPAAIVAMIDDIVRLKHALARLAQREMEVCAALLEACNIAMGSGYYVDKHGLVGLDEPDRKRIAALQLLGDS